MPTPVRMRISKDPKRRLSWESPSPNQMYRGVVAGVFWLVCDPGMNRKDPVPFLRSRTIELNLRIMRFRRSRGDPQASVAGPTGFATETNLPATYQETDSKA